MASNHVSVMEDRDFRDRLCKLEKCLRDPNSEIHVDGLLVDLPHYFWVYIIRFFLGQYYLSCQRLQFSSDSPKQKCGEFSRSL